MFWPGLANLSSSIRDSTLDDLRASLDALPRTGVLRQAESRPMSGADIATLAARFDAEVPRDVHLLLERWGALDLEVLDPRWPREAPPDRLWPTWLSRDRVVTIGTAAFATHPMWSDALVARLHRERVLPVAWFEREGAILGWKGGRVVEIERDGDEITISGDDDDASIDEVTDEADEATDADGASGASLLARLVTAVRELAEGMALFSMPLEDAIARSLDADLDAGEDQPIEALCVRAIEPVLHAHLPALLEKYVEHHAMYWLVELAERAPDDAWMAIRPALERLYELRGTYQDLLLATLVEREPRDRAHHARLDAILSTSLSAIPTSDMRHLVVPIRLVAVLPAELVPALHAKLAVIARHPSYVGGEAVAALARIGSPELDKVLPALLRHVTDGGLASWLQALAGGVSTPKARKALLAAYKRVSPTSSFQILLIERLLALGLVDPVMDKVLARSVDPKARALREQVREALARPIAKKSPTKKSSTKKSPTKKSPTKKSPTKKSPTKKSPTKKSRTKQSPTKSTKKTAAKEAFERRASIGGTSARRPPARRPS